MKPEAYYWVYVDKDEAWYPSVLIGKTIRMPFPNELVTFEPDNPPVGYTVGAEIIPPTNTGGEAVSEPPTGLKLATKADWEPTGAWWD